MCAAGAGCSMAGARATSWLPQHSPAAGRWRSWRQTGWLSQPAACQQATPCAGSAAAGTAACPGAGRVAPAPDMRGLQCTAGSARPQASGLLYRQQCTCQLHQQLARGLRTPGQASRAGVLRRCLQMCTPWRGWATTMRPQRQLSWLSSACRASWSQPPRPPLSSRRQQWQQRQPGSHRAHPLPAPHHTSTGLRRTTAQACQTQARASTDSMAAQRPADTGTASPPPRLPG